MADDVKDLQRALMMCNYYPGSRDGIMGEKTVKAIKRFQRKNDLKESGEVDDAFRARLTAKLTEASAKAIGLIPKIMAGSGGGGHGRSQ